MQFLGGDQRKTLGQRKPRLRPEHRAGARARAIGAELSLGEHEAQELLVLNHGDGELRITMLVYRKRLGQPRGKASNLKPQASGKFQAPSSKAQGSASGCAIRHFWSLIIGASLELGGWCLELPPRHPLF